MLLTKRSRTKLPVTEETYVSVKQSSQLTSAQKTGQKTTTVKDAAFAKLQPSPGIISYGTGLVAPIVNNPAQPTTDKGKLKGREFVDIQKYDDLFPNAPCRLALDPDTQDVEGHYSKCLYQAKKQNFVEEQIFCLKKISDLYLQNKDFF